MIEEKPYGFTVDTWEALFDREQLPIGRPVGIVIEGYHCSLLDRERFRDNYVQTDLFKEFIIPGS